jgi:hypothetical protein
MDWLAVAFRIGYDARSDSCWALAQRVRDSSWPNIHHFDQLCFLPLENQLMVAHFAFWICRIVRLNREIDLFVMIHFWMMLWIGVWLWNVVLSKLWLYQSEIRLRFLGYGFQIRLKWLLRGISFESTSRLKGMESYAFSSSSCFRVSITFINHIWIKFTINTNWIICIFIFIT